MNTHELLKQAEEVQRKMKRELGTQAARAEKRPSRPIGRCRRPRHISQKRSRNRMPVPCRANRRRPSIGKKAWSLNIDDIRTQLDRTFAADHPEWPARQQDHDHLERYC